jgi:hypothetical protein
MTSPSRAARTMEVARVVSDVLTRMGAAHAVIGSVALAVHGYVRATRDLDFAVLVPPVPRLSELADAVRGEGLAVELSAPAPDDELGGVLTVVGDDFDPVQIVNFYNPPRPPSRLVHDALVAAGVPPALPFAVVDLPHLVALKLATGAYRDEIDVGELLEARPGLDLGPVRAVCERHGLGDALARVLGRIGDA